MTRTTIVPLLQDLGAWGTTAMTTPLLDLLVKHSANEEIAAIA